MIFISHKEVDSDKALKLSKYLNDKGVTSYLDVLDKKISNGNITSNVVSNLRKSTHLIVVFSEHTQGSMWVPFELGVAYERDYGIGVALWPDDEKINIETPEYLDDFPVMKGSDDIDEYIKLYKSNFAVGTESLHESRNFTKFSASTENYAERFITSLKSAIQ